MKIPQIIPLSILIVLVYACTGTKTYPDAVVFKGKLVHAKDSMIIIYKGNYRKEIPINADGTFKDTLKVKNGTYQLMLMQHKKILLLYLKNNAILELNADLNDFESTLAYDNTLASYNTYLYKKDQYLASPAGLKKAYYRYDQVDFDKHIAIVESTLDSLRIAYISSDIENNDHEIANNKRRIERFVKKYEGENNQFSALKRGVVSPLFTDYESADGGTKSLADFKGSFVYIDVWASWCGPCKAQFPYLSEIKKEYADKNIKFVGVSVDVPKDRDKWLASLKEFNLSGIQLMAPKAFESEFVQVYGIKAIPRFILIDPKGKIVDYDAPRPSQTEKLNSFFEEAGV